MRYTEGSRPSESPPPSADISCEDQLNRSNSDASTLTAENCQDILHRSANVKLEMTTKWTDEKHNLYLEHLEDSFVKQLHQSIGLHAQCSNRNKRDGNSTVTFPVNVEFTTEPRGCWEETNYNRHDPLSPDSPSPIKSPWVYCSKRIQMHTPEASAYMPGHIVRCDTENHGKVVTSCGLNTCSQQCSANGDSHSLTIEGTDQNFVDEEDQNTKSRVKRLKKVLPD